MDSGLTLCPECLKRIDEINSTVQCPKYKHAAVCMSHCYGGCKYLEQSSSVIKCKCGEIKQNGKEMGHKKISSH